jgi:XRE family transcriptional regulator, regulator of sulfur utilization
MNLGKALRELRKQKSLSQLELAQIAGITQAAMSGIENGNRPSHENLQKLCTALGVPESLVYVMGMEKNDVPDEKKVLYDSLFPIIQNLILQIAVK